MVKAKKPSTKEENKIVNKEESENEKVKKKTTRKSSAKKRTTTKKPSVRKGVKAMDGEESSTVEAISKKDDSVIQSIKSNLDEIKIDDVDLSKENTLASDDTSKSTSLDIDNKDGDTKLNEDDSLSHLDNNVDMQSVDWEDTLPEINLGEEVVNKPIESPIVENDNNAEEQSPSVDLNDGNTSTVIWSSTDYKDSAVSVHESKDLDSWLDPFDWLNIDDITSNDVDKQGSASLEDIDDNTKTSPASDTTSTDRLDDKDLGDIASNSNNNVNNISIDNIVSMTPDTITPIVEQQTPDTITVNTTDEGTKDPDILLNNLSNTATVIDTVAGMSKKKKIIMIWSMVVWFILLGVSAYVVLSTFKPNDFTDDINANLLGVESGSNLLWIDLSTWDDIKQVQADPWVDKFGNPIVLDPKTDIVVNTGDWSALDDTTTTWSEEDSHLEGSPPLDHTDDFSNEDELTLDDIANINQKPTELTTWDNNTPSTSDIASNNSGVLDDTNSDTVDTENDIGTIWATDEQIANVQDKIATSLDEVKQLLTITKEKNNTQVMRLLAIILTRYRDLNTSIEEKTYSNFSDIETEMSEISYLLDKAKSYIIQ